VLKRKVRQTVAFIIYYSGLIRLVSRRRGRAVVLAYHKICENEGAEKGHVPGMSVRPMSFRKHVRYLKRHFEVVSLEKLILLLERGERVENKCVITFDDGWVDNYLNAYPILRKYHLPGTIFLVSEFVGSKRYMWFEVVARAMSDRKGEANEKALDLTRYHYLSRIGFCDIYFDSELKIEDKIDIVIRRMKAFTQLEIGKAIDELSSLFEGRIPLESSTEHFLSWEQIKEMGRDGISFGSHTASHPKLTLETFEDVRKELTDSKKTIEAELNRGVKSFCYPYGNYSSEVREAVREAAYIGATTYEHGFVSDRTDVFLMPRIGMHEDICSSVAMFACRVEGVPVF
jgi:peptidoglycan/xylan/chitin deacetylase (PgdA/CDA1 family)